jgi:hypothetical protein
MKKILFSFFLIQLLITGQRVQAQFQKNEFWELAEILSDCIFSGKYDALDNFQIDDIIKPVNKNHFYFDLYRFDMYSMDYSEKYIDCKRKAVLYAGFDIPIEKARTIFYEIKPGLENFKGWSWTMEESKEFDVTYYGTVSMRYLKIHLKVDRSLAEYNEAEYDVFLEIIKK